MAETLAPPAPQSLSSVRDSLTAGALLSLIARAHAVSLTELLVTAQAAPKKLLDLLKELKEANLIEIEGLTNLSELDPIFAKHQSHAHDSSDVPYADDRRQLIKIIAAERPSSKVSISRKGFSRALAL